MPVRKHIARRPPSLAETRNTCLWRVAVVTQSRLVTPNGLVVGKPPPYSGRVGLAAGISGPSESVLISDGGLATELEARGHDLSDPLWSARLLSDDPREIVAVHAAYFRAGAKIATSRFSAGLARQWIAAGARIVGGCCRVGPSDIAAIADLDSVVDR
jgi:Homocysteine S-methyltransferase